MMKDMGEKMDGGEVSSEKRTSVYYPCLYLSDDQTDILEGAKVGDEITLMVKCRVSSMTIREDDDKDEGKTEKSATLEIREAGNAREKSPDEKMGA